jgi:hypothetical protein
LINELLIDRRNNMGAINYGTGDIVTLGLDVSGDVEEDYGINGVELMYEYIKDKVEDIVHTWFNLDLEYGYYEGFYIAVKKNYSTDKELKREVAEGIIRPEVAKWWTLEDEEKEEIKQEAKELKEELKGLIDESFVVCFPSWCTGYCDMEASKTEIDKAINKALSEL